MSDRIFIKDLLLRAIVGINDDERVNRQDVVISLSLETDTRSAGRTDDIEQAVNYRSIAKQVIDLVESSQYLLVEKMAEEIAGLCLRDSRVRRVQVTVEKPGAIRFAQSVGVTIERSREDG